MKAISSRGITTKVPRIECGVQDKVGRLAAICQIRVELASYMA
jgi:hypothetical protein